MKLRLHSDTIIFPATHEPAWAPKVDHWHQLDAPAFCLTEFMWRRREQLERPVAIFLACEGASNPSDFLFASQGAGSAKKFSHTLPNVRASSLLQVLEWHGHVLCFQNDPLTLHATLEQVPILFPGVLSWVFNFNHHSKEITLLECNNAQSYEQGFFSIAGVDPRDLNKPNNALIDWLHQIEQRSLHR